MFGRYPFLNLCNKVTNKLFSRLWLRYASLNKDTVLLGAYGIRAYYRLLRANAVYRSDNNLPLVFTKECHIRPTTHTGGVLPMGQNACGMRANYDNRHTTRKVMSGVTNIRTGCGADTSSLMSSLQGSTEARLDISCPVNIGFLKAESINVIKLDCGGNPMPFSKVYIARDRVNVA